jgi:hypothetical protein
LDAKPPIHLCAQRKQLMQQIGTNVSSQVLPCVLPSYKLRPSWPRPALKESRANITQVTPL